MQKKDMLGILYSYVSCTEYIKRIEISKRDVGEILFSMRRPNTGD
jgi:hypothetical protein